jgi:3-hydroxyacyl-CoA dehydrogenase
MCGSVKIVGIIGEGKMGTNLFQFISGFPFEMRWIVSPDADTEKISRAWFKKVLRGLNADIIDVPASERMNRAVITSDPGTIHDCDLIIEAVTEDEQAKIELFRQVDRIASAACIFASNSSSILPSALVPSERRKGHVIGLHFFYPASLKNIVELIVPEGTSNEVIRSAKEFLQVIGRNYLLQNDENAFLLNRVFLEFQLEAWQISTEGLMTPAEVDALIHEKFFPLGAFECFDAVGIDVMLPAIRNYTGRYENKEKYQDLLTVLETMKREGRLGMKSGGGFYNHDEDQPVSRDGLITIPEDVQRSVEYRLRKALENAVERLSANPAFSTEQFLQGLREYSGY